MRYPAPLLRKRRTPRLLKDRNCMWPVQIDPWVAAGGVVATATTDAAYVAFTSAVVARRRVPAATWSSIWYLLVVRRDQLHQQLGLRAVCGRRLLDSAPICR
jgi:hypothetical protein